MRGTTTVVQAVIPPPYGEYVFDRLLPDVAAVRFVIATFFLTVSEIAAVSRLVYGRVVSVATRTLVAGKKNARGYTRYKKRRYDSQGYYE